ncbi:TIGR04282 family arsenosugar biosynthesis glycosyltransferase [Pontibacter sp. JH31]|uniref:TIGR04282 family arsenosugar biosynthesis glycosyltransferase n=1 Tax=Pontibacter aquaedesilientis TaxID=2766980 RepID=A0ABR7XBA8_9BACT|nr:TIGR04282 family arsenosugar biosynthesis glycosyltransferase [Pontibacter aquaedesilientis]MBD1395562.1 TIGR04282 family arsenosugar biosynthesis glycosyltransferase [Pontibacter aquaedesilientis]
MTEKKLLMLFVRNPELGKVKTRLAASVGPETALDIYLHLLRHTRDITQELPVDKVVYYSEKVEQQDLWPDARYLKKVQPPGDLGEKMKLAFETAFAEGYTSVVIIGSDCHQLTSDIVNQAFDELKTHEVVIGPALDGGYYLLGMRHLHPELFHNKRWSTEHVFPDTLYDIERLHLSHTLLPYLSDIDKLEDLQESWPDLN